MRTSVSNRITRRCIAIGVLALMLAACGPENQHEANPDAAAIKLEPPLEREMGFAWIVKIPVDPDVRKFRLFENGKELGPSIAVHDEIRNKGLGLYSHWKAEDGSIRFYFSTSDNSDPNTNGRSYELK